MAKDKSNGGAGNSASDAKQAEQTTRAARDRHYAISLRGAPTHVIEAATPQEAWEKYKTLCGIVKTTQTPNISVADPPGASQASGETSGWSPDAKPVIDVNAQGQSLNETLPNTPENPDPVSSLIGGDAGTFQDAGGIDLGAGDAAGDAAKPKGK